MSNPVGNTRDLDASRREALHGLFSSLGPTVNDSPSSGAKLSAEQLHKLSEKIDEILGEGGDRDPTQGDQPGQPLNDDNLPTIDISEQVDEEFQTSSFSSVPEHDMIPLSLLPPDEQERRRRERERILDILEEEERLQQLQEERDAEEERKEIIRKRKESAKAELEQLRAARDLQKRMGRALVRYTKGKEGKEEDKQEEATHLKSQVTSPVTKKSVSFAVEPAIAADESDQQPSICLPDWGDVTPGRLRAQNRIPLVSTAEAQRYPMKMRVVERRPMETRPPFPNDADSDDESPSAGSLSPHMENDSSDPMDGSVSSENNLSNDEPLEEGFDYDAARHHREIALEYHKRRHAINAESAGAIVADTLDNYKQYEASNGQLKSSHFRADRMATAYDKSHSSVSTSIGQTVIPTFHQKSLRNSVKLGKLENGRLVGEESGESESEDETIREVIQMLQTGSIQNAGPDLKPSSMPTITPRQNSDAVESPTLRTSLATTARGTKSSRFKLARGGITERSTFRDDNSRDNIRLQPTISNVAERKAPRPSPGQRFPVHRPSQSPVKTKLAPSMITDSPSFPMTTSTSTVIIPGSGP